MTPVNWFLLLLYVESSPHAGVCGLGHPLPTASFSHRRPVGVATRGDCSFDPVVSNHGAGGDDACFALLRVIERPIDVWIDPRAIHRPGMTPLAREEWQDFCFAICRREIARRLCPVGMGLGSVFNPAIGVETRFGVSDRRAIRSTFISNPVVSIAMGQIELARSK